MATDMEPEHGLLWIHDTDDRQAVGFTTGMPLATGTPAARFGGSRMGATD
jgi:hypothetical protein